MIIKNLHNEKIENLLQLNEHHCPSKLIKNHETICMCRQFRDQIELRQEGKCECGLYKIDLSDEEGEK